MFFSAAKLAILAILLLHTSASPFVQPRQADIEARLRQFASDYVAGFNGDDFIKGRHKDCKHFFLPAAAFPEEVRDGVSNEFYVDFEGSLRALIDPFEIAAPSVEPDVGSMTVVMKGVKGTGQWRSVVPGAKDHAYDNTYNIKLYTDPNGYDIIRVDEEVDLAAAGAAFAKGGVCLACLLNKSCENKDPTTKVAVDCLTNSGIL